MKPFKTIPQEALRRIRYVLTDIDDTLTTDGLFPSISLKAMEELELAGVQVIPVTGRPAGWCDHIARMWPVAAVVGENGAFYYSYDREKRKMNRWYRKGDATRRTDMIRLEQLAAEVLASVPGSALASDQAYRVSDLAIDFCEDVAPLPEGEIRRIVEIMEAGGATTKVSSIHVNSWFGVYDKLTTSRKCLEDLFDCDMEKDNERIAYLGDSPNDVPMFACFEHSIGVANVRNFKLDHEPKWVTQGMCAEGFAEAALAIAEAKSGAN